MAQDGQDEEDKTEDPSERRIRQAIERGDVPKSIEVNSWFMLGALTLALAVYGATGSRDLALAMRNLLEKSHLISVDARGLTAMFQYAGMAALGALAIPLVFAIVASIAANMVQHPLLFTTEHMMPQLSRISPLAGLKRMFGREAVAQFIKGLAKIVIVGAVMAVALWPERGRFESFADLDPSAVMSVSLTLVLKLLGWVLAIYFFVAVGDYVYQRFTWTKRQRMTRKDVKDEYKETEGNPEIKAKIKRLRIEAARKRMMNKVPQASVVIMNPTHYAVALQYETGMQAPVCVAKGVDQLALKIKEVALAHEIPVIENPPLARALHATVELDGEIPTEHYKAVAEVIGYVLRLRRRVNG